jgi:peptidylprolyl isomerase
MMIDRRALLSALAASALIYGVAAVVPRGLEMASAAPATDPANQVVMTTKDGQIVIQLRPDLAPNHVKQIETLVKQKFYDGIVFHRVIPGFMAQTGDPTGTGTGGSKLPDLKAEFSSEPFRRGTIGMARASSPDSANSQFFICFDDANFLNGQYTVVGQVISGMDVVDKIKKGSSADNGAVTNPDKIVSMRMKGGK